MADDECVGEGPLYCQRCHTSLGGEKEQARNQGNVGYDELEGTLSVALAGKFLYHLRVELTLA